MDRGGFGTPVPLPSDSAPDGFWVSFAEEYPDSTVWVWEEYAKLADRGKVEACGFLLAVARISRPSAPTEADWRQAVLQDLAVIGRW